MNKQMSTINVHEYPDNPNDLPHYQVAVMGAAANGAQVEYTHIGDNFWQETERPAWDWSSYDYRIAAPKIAKGHNPAGLSESQVDVNGGWRLLQDSEIYGEQFRADIEMWDTFCEEWLNGDWCGNDTTTTYRTKKPEGWFKPDFLPKPEVPLAELDTRALNKHVCDEADSIALNYMPVFTKIWNAALKYERSRAK